MATNKKQIKTRNKENPAKGQPVQESKKIAFNPAVSQKLLLPVFIIYCALIIFGVLHHESWADEAQSWLIARDNSLAGILKLLPSEGHPPLWYLLLYPVTHLGLPYEAIKWLTAIIAIASVFILLFKSDLPVALKILLPFSYIFFFEYSLFGRSYCLIIFFLAAIISLYPNRFEKPWLFAFSVIGLFNTHILAFSFALGFTGLYFIDAIQYKKFNKNTLAAFALMIIGGLYLVPYLMRDKMTSHFQQFITDHSEKIMNAIKGGILADGNASLALILLIAAVVLLAQRTKPLLLAICGISGVLYILGYRYGGTLRHFAVLFVILLGSYGIAQYYKDDALNMLKSLKQNTVQYGIWLMCIIILCQLPATLKSYRQDIGGLYSDSKNVAEYLTGNTGKNNVIVAWQATTCLGVLPYMPGRKLYYAECQRYGTHYIYDSCFRAEIWMNPVDYAVKIAHDNFKDSMGNLVFLFNYPIMPQTEKYLDLVYTTSEPTARWDETFYIYKFKENVK